MSQFEAFLTRVVQHPFVAMFGTLSGIIAAHIVTYATNNNIILSLIIIMAAGMTTFAYIIVKQLGLRGEPVQPMKITLFTHFLFMAAVPSVGIIIANTK